MDSVYLDVVSGGSACCEKQRGVYRLAGGVGWGGQGLGGPGVVFGVAVWVGELGGP